MFMNVMLFFKDKFQQVGVHPWDINSLQDIQKLPLMNKEDFRKEYPLGMCCVEKNIYSEMHMSSGSTGTPVVLPYPEMI